MDASLKDIRALERGLRTLQVIQAHSGLSLGKIHEQTGLPKSTLRRILQTLENNSWIRRSLADGLYRANLHMSVRPNSERSFDYVAAAASPVLQELCSRLQWPSDLVVRRGNQMEVVESTRGSTPLSIFRCRLGERVDFRHSAVGKAYMAFCSDSERDELFATAAACADGDGNRRDLEIWRRELREVRSRGYGARSPEYTGATSLNPDGFDGLQAIAVPILRDGRVHGCLNMVWPARAYSVGRFAETNLCHLQSAATAIAARLDPEFAGNPLTNTAGASSGAAVVKHPEEAAPSDCSRSGMLTSYVVDHGGIEEGSWKSMQLNSLQEE